MNPQGKEYQQMYQTYSEWAKQAVYYDQQKDFKSAYHSYLYALALGTQLLLKTEKAPFGELHFGKQRIKLTVIAQRIEAIQKILFQQQATQEQNAFLQQKDSDDHKMGELERQYQSTPKTMQHTKNNIQQPKKHITQYTQRSQKLQQNRFEIQLQPRSLPSNGNQKTPPTVNHQQQKITQSKPSNVEEITENNEVSLNYAHQDPFASMRSSMAKERDGAVKRSDEAYAKDLQMFKAKFTTLMPQTPTNIFERIIHNEFLQVYPLQKPEDYIIEIRHLKILREIENSTLKSFEDLEFRDRIKSQFNLFFRQIENEPNHILNQLVANLAMALSPHVSDQPNITDEEVKTIVQEFILLAGALLVSKFWVLQNTEFRHVLSQSINLYLVDTLFKHIEFSLFIPLYRRCFPDPCNSFRMNVLELKDDITPRHLDVENLFLLDREAPYPYEPLVEQFSLAMSTPGILPVLKKTTELIKSIGNHAKEYWADLDSTIPSSKFITSADHIIPLFIYFVIRSGYVGLMPHYLCMDAYIQKNWIPGDYEYAFTIIQSVVHFICSNSRNFYQENYNISKERYPGTY